MESDLVDLLGLSGKVWKTVIGTCRPLRMADTETVRMEES